MQAGRAPSLSLTYPCIMLADICEARELQWWKFSSLARFPITAHTWCTDTNEGVSWEHE